MFSGLTDEIGDSVGVSSSMCAFFSQCGCALLSAMLTVGMDAIEPGANFLSGCLADAINSLCSEITGALCDHHDCPNCPHESWQCRFFGIIVGGVAGCVGLMLGAGEAAGIPGQQGMATGGCVGGVTRIGFAGLVAGAFDKGCRYGM